MAEPTPPMLDEDALRELREQVRATQEAAERIVRGATPPHGWDAPRSAAESISTEAQALAALLDSLRALLPADLREQINDLIRTLLRIVRALLDLLIDRLEPAQRGAAPAVEEIPVD